MSATRAASFLIPLALFCSFAAADDSLSDLPKKAVERSQITSAGSRPFVLRAKVLEITNPANADYQAEIEEYWVAPNKWRRTVKTNKFTQTLIVNGDKTSEQLTGDYSPNWLRTIVSALFDPGAALKGVDLTHSSDNPVLGGSQVCRRFTSVSGVAPASNKVFSTYCFNNGLLDSFGVPGYRASYADYKNFDSKKVARTINEQIENGTDLRATIEELTELKAPDETQFAIQETNTPLKTIHADEATLRSLALDTPAIVWPAVHSGSNKGTLGLYVCLDRAGHVREIYELNSSNPGLSDVVRDQVKNWTFKVASSQGAAVQVESILTFAFHPTDAK